MNRIHGVVIGIVTDNRDPNNQGRVRVKFPWLSDSNQTPWARIATLMSGKQRGSWFMPEVDDEVLVSFDHGDINHPYIVGYLWNGVDTPPNDGITTKVRRLRTVSGHVLEFDDRPGQERILIQTKGGQQIELKDTPATITIQTKLGNAITINEGPLGISIKAETGPVQVSCLKADVTAKTLVQVNAPTLQVNAPLAQFTGLVVATAIQTGAIVSGAYNPGVPGNLFGL